MNSSLIEVNSKQIFPAQFTAVGKMIDFLITFESFHKLFRNIAINPNKEYLIVLILFIVEFVVEIFMDETVNN